MELMLVHALKRDTLSQVTNVSKGASQHQDDAPADKRVYAAAGVRYEAVRSGWTKVSGAMKASSMLACSATAYASTILPSVGSSLATSVAAVICETNGWSLISHKFGLIVTVGGVAPATTSRDNVMMCPSNAVLLA